MAVPEHLVEDAADAAGPSGGEGRVHETGRSSTSLLNVYITIIKYIYIHI